MSSFGSTIAGLVGGVMFILSLFAFRDRNWKAGCAWFFASVTLITLLTYLDKP